jgi:hypothetical protein
LVYRDDGTIGTSRRKVHYKSSFLAIYRVVKIVHSFSEMVLRTIKNYKAHYSLLKMNSVIMGVSRVLEKFAK